MSARPKLAFTFALVSALGLFGGGIAMGALLHLAACPLCIIQRMLYLLVALIALVGLLSRGAIWTFFSALAMLATSGLGLFVAGYQSWLQHHPTGIGCVADSPWWEDFVYWAGNKLPLFFGVGGVCEDASWKLLGLSIAELSCIAFAALMLASAIALFSKR